MAFKLNISDKGKTYHLETDSEEFIGKKIGDKISGNEISGDLAGYELEIKGTSDAGRSFVSCGKYRLRVYP